LREMQAHNRKTFPTFFRGALGPLAQHSARCSDVHRLIGNRDFEKGAAAAALDEIEGASMCAYQLVGDRQAEARAAAAGGAMEGGEEILARLLGKAGPGILDENAAPS